METINLKGHFFVEHANGKKVRVVYKSNGVTIGVRGIKEHPDMSDETTCFSSTVDINGKTVGHASNDGCGGCSMVNFDDITSCNKFYSVEKPQHYLCTEDIVDWLVNLTLDFKDITKTGVPLNELLRRYPKDGLW